MAVRVAGDPNAANNGLFFLLGDHLGSTSKTVTTGAALHAELRYKPWGETRYSTGNTPTDVRFTGQHEESGLGGLYFYDARWYASKIAPFISKSSQKRASQVAPKLPLTCT